ncbi:MAG: hypothetical protein V1709_07055 [Planctomycetota bacterium]
MENKFDITLYWCNKHKNWWVTNCPDCMIDANEESIKREGTREMVKWIESHSLIKPNKDSLTKFEPFYQIEQRELKKYENKT